MNEIVKTFYDGSSMQEIANSYNISLLKVEEIIRDYINDRDSDLDFEYKSRIQAEKEVEVLREIHADW